MRDTQTKWTSFTHTQHTHRSNIKLTSISSYIHATQLVTLFLRFLLFFFLFVFLHFRCRLYFFFVFYFRWCSFTLLFLFQLKFNCSPLFAVTCVSLLKQLIIARVWFSCVQRPAVFWSNTHNLCFFRHLPGMWWVTSCHTVYSIQPYFYKEIFIYWNIS